MKKKQYDAILNNWRIDDGCLVGQVYEDTKIRYTGKVMIDGEILVTSAFDLRLITTLCDGKIIKTRNAKYTLGVKSTLIY